MNANLVSIETSGKIHEKITMTAEEERKDQLPKEQN